MSLSSSNMSNAFIKAYLSQINNQNSTSVSSNSSVIDEEKLAQQVAFEMVLQQMMDSMGNSMMSDLVSTALTENNEFNINDSLNLMSNFNSNIRSLNTIKFQASSYNQSENSSLGKLGLTASKYESNLNPGAIANNPGDYGGKSYGAWQFSSKTGSLNSFLNSLKESNTVYYSKLTEAKAKDGNTFGSSFDAAWTNIAKTDKDGFLAIQQDYIEKTYYDKAADTLRTKYGFDINVKSDALKESLWSTVVQHGVGGAVSIFSKLNLNKSDRGIINDLYNERQKVNIYFRSSSEQIKQSVYNRFSREKADMLNMLSGENV